MNFWAWLWKCYMPCTKRLLRDAGIIKVQADYEKKYVREV